MYMQARYYDPVIGRFYSNDPNCTNVIKKGGSSGRESRAGAVKRIVSEVEAIGDFKNKGEADWLYELIDDRNLEVTVQAGLMTVRVLLPLRLAPNGHVQADAIIVGGYSVHGQSTIRHRPDGTYGIYDGKYDFEMHWNMSPREISREMLRNFGTFFGAPISGTPFQIHYHGNVGTVIPYRP
tara:strand:- start:41 stop:583 length:543 start_codon:yes stop_codon:yes gene_type:complete